MKIYFKNTIGKVHKKDATSTTEELDTLNLACHKLARQPDTIVLATTLLEIF